MLLKLDNCKSLESIHQANFTSKFEGIVFKRLLRITNISDHKGV